MSIQFQKPSGLIRQTVNRAPNFEYDYPDSANCFSYALRLLWRDYAFPGNLLHLSENVITSDQITLKNIRRELRKNKLIRIDQRKLSDDVHGIVCFINPKVDYHLYSRDYGGKFSGKVKGQPPQIVEKDVVRPSRDLVTKEYPVYVGCFVPENSYIDYMASI